MSQAKGTVVAIATLVGFCFGLIVGLFIPFGEPPKTITETEMIPTTITVLEVSRHTTEPFTFTQATYRYVGSVDSKIYHYPSCSYVERIKPENEIWFIDENDAKSKGYRPCEVCKPPG